MKPGVCHWEPSETWGLPLRFATMFATEVSQVCHWLSGMCSDGSLGYNYGCGYGPAHGYDYGYGCGYSCGCGYVYGHG